MRATRLVLAPIVVLGIAVLPAFAQQPTPKNRIALEQYLDCSRPTDRKSSTPGDGWTR
jgi:hypothetical protein